MKILKKNVPREKVKYKDAKAAFFFLLPSMTGICLFFVFPFFDTVRRSFFDVVGQNFAGFAQYQSVISNDSFQLASVNTAKFIGICIPILLLLSLILALLMRQIHPKGRRIKTLYLLPMSIPVASMVLLWQLLFHDKGIINTMLVQSGAESVSFMNSGAAFWVLVGTYVWKNVGYDMVLWLAGLDGISESMYEAANVDGAGAWQCFRYITIPSLIPTLGMVAIISLLNSFKVFREAYLVAGSYPHDSIYLLQHLFNNWFVNMDISRLCAAAVLLCLVLLVIIMLIQKFLQAED
ncbi:carbohydrate ABC transporter permease [Scatolibacter rhodanostii]|uniref:carbohydrate ABC transporter permease n=1 Tax=Scatolibacter rhodanostii TaxID=2014781 RepID=UPI000C084E59|nr:sugar ABC transporter permease [Scatolibacter rhodanostii]